MGLLLMWKDNTITVHASAMVSYYPTTRRSRSSTGRFFSSSLAWPSSMPGSSIMPWVEMFHRKPLKPELTLHNDHSLQRGRHYSRVSTLSPPSLTAGGGGAIGASSRGGAGAAGAARASVWSAMSQSAHMRFEAWHAAR